MADQSNVPMGISWRALCAGKTVAETALWLLLRNRISTIRIAARPSHFSGTDPAIRFSICRRMARLMASVLVPDDGNDFHLSEHLLD
jgi:hypothetical protein